MVLDIPLNFVTPPIKLSIELALIHNFYQGVYFPEIFPYPWGKMILNADWEGKINHWTSKSISSDSL